MPIFLVSVNEPALLGMPDIEVLDMLAINWHTREVLWQIKEINKHKAEWQDNTKAFQT